MWVQDAWVYFLGPPSTVIANSNSFMWFLFNLPRRKICAVLYKTQQMVFMCKVSKCKKTLLGVVAISAQCKPHSSRVSCWKLTAPFPTNHWLHLSPSAPFSTLHAHMYIQFVQREDDISTSEAFSIRHNKCGTILWKWLINSSPVISRKGRTERY